MERCSRCRRLVLLVSLVLELSAVWVWAGKRSPEGWVVGVKLEF